MAHLTIDATLGDLAAAETALGRVLAVKFDKDGGAKLRYHVAKLARLVAAETRHYYEERDALVMRYGDNGKIAPASPNWAAFVEALKPIADVPTTIAWSPITEAMIAPYPDITAADLIALGPLFELDPPAAGEAAT